MAPIERHPPLPAQGTLSLDPQVLADLQARAACPATPGARMRQLRAQLGGLAGRGGIFALTLGAALLATLPVVLATGADLGVTAQAFLDGSLGSRFAIAETLVQMIPLLIAGLAVAVSFHAGLFNMGVEGQLIFGGLVAGVIGATLPLPPVFLMLSCLAGGIAGGALMALVPAVLKAWRGVHEVVTTIMMNFIAQSVAIYAVSPGGPFVSASQPSATEKIPRAARLPVIWEDTRLHAGLIVALVAVAGLWWLLYRTPLGYRIRLLGANAQAARASGVSVGRVTVVTLLISGGLGGLAGAVQVLGVYGRFFDSFSAGYGWTGIAVALLAGLSPIGAIVAAFFFAMLSSGSVQMQAVAGISREMVNVVSGLVVGFVAIQPATIRLAAALRARLGRHRPAAQETRE